SPGQDRTIEIDTHLKAAQIIILLVSPDFIASDYCWGSEMQQALRMHRQKSARIIPVLIRPTDWEATIFSTIQLLPSNSLPVSLWSNQDSAWLDISEGIRIYIDDIMNYSKVIDEAETETYEVLGPYPKTLMDCNWAIHLDPNNLFAYYSKAT